MTISDRLEEYLEGETDAIQVIRELTGVFNPEHAIGILSLVCSITRVEQGDMDREFFKEHFIDRPRELQKKKEEENA